MNNTKTKSQTRTKRAKYEWVSTNAKGWFDGGKTGLGPPALWGNKNVKIVGDVFYKRIRVS